MKVLPFTLSFVLSFTALAAEQVTSEVVTPDHAWLWRRTGTGGDVALDQGAMTVRHETADDWSLNCFRRLQVSIGDRFVFEFDSSALSDRRGKLLPCVVTRDGKGEVVNWMFARTEVNPGAHGRLEFVVPHGVATIEPRFVGECATDLRISNVLLRRLPNILGEDAPSTPIAIANSGLTVSVAPADGALTVTDRRTGRTWTPAAIEGQSDCLVSRFSKSFDGRAASYRLVNTRDLRCYGVRVALDGAELTVAISGLDESMTANLDYPGAFATEKGDRLIVPMNEGMGFPVEERHPGLWNEALYSGHGLCMAFFGVAADATGAGWMMIVETPDDAAMKVRTDRVGNLAAGILWEPSFGKPGSGRKLRYRFLDRGGHVAMAKQYRAYMKGKGNVVTFAEKAKSRPRVLDLLGAPNVWCWDDDENRKRGVLESLRRAGAKKVLWSAGGSEAFVKELAATDGVLVGRYDIYQDIMDPANRDRLPHWHGDWVNEAFPQDINWYGSDPSQWRHGWPVDAKSGPRIDCAVMCDRQALPYARKRIGAELRRKPFNTRFIDTTTASPWRECWNPAHPMTRSESRAWKVKLLGVVSDEFGLVCGSETGHDAAVPVCDYFEGMLSIGPYRIDEAGRDMWRTVDEVPERVAKYQVGERYRLPLWELVYHDCTVAHWYWGDYNNKLPATWRKRDLFNALYATPPMYLFHGYMWNEWKDRMLASLKTALPASEAAAGTEMTDHLVLTHDRSVQRTRFANGVEVTVNFGGRPYRLADGTELPPSDWRMKISKQTNDPKGK